MGGWQIIAAFALGIVALVVYCRRRAPAPLPRPFEADEGGSMIGSGKSSFSEAGGRVRGTGDSMS